MQLQFAKYFVVSYPKDLSATWLQVLHESCCYYLSVCLFWWQFPCKAKIHLQLHRRPFIIGNEIMPLIQCKTNFKTRTVQISSISDYMKMSFLTLRLNSSDIGPTIRTCVFWVTFPFITMNRQWSPKRSHGTINGSGSDLDTEIRVVSTKLGIRSDIKQEEI